MKNLELEQLKRAELIENGNGEPKRVRDWLQYEFKIEG